MTFDEILQSKKPFLLPDEIADVIEAAPNTIREQAQKEPAKLGFPVIVCSSRVKIPREGFIFFMKYGRPVV